MGEQDLGGPEEQAVGRVMEIGHVDTVAPVTVHNCNSLDLW